MHIRRGTRSSLGLLLAAALLMGSATPAVAAAVEAPDTAAPALSAEVENGAAKPADVGSGADAVPNTQAVAGTVSGTGPEADAAITSDVAVDAGMDDAVPTTETPAAEPPAGIEPTPAPSADPAPTEEPLVIPSAPDAPASQPSGQEKAPSPADSEAATETTESEPAAVDDRPTTVKRGPVIAPKLTLLNQVKNGIAGKASAGDWTPTATPVDAKGQPVTMVGAADGVTASIRADKTYQLAQHGGPGGYTLLSLECDLGTDNKFVDLDNARVTLQAGDEVSCVFTNAFQSIHISKRAWTGSSVSWDWTDPTTYLQLPDEAVITWGTPVVWNYLVTNTGGAAIEGITVNDDGLANQAVNCPAAVLAPGADMVCTAIGPVDMARPG